MTDLFGLWPHQEEAVTAIETAWRDGIRSVCYQLSTGGGKSRVLRTITDNHAASRKTIYVMAHTRKLVGQLSRELDDAGIRHGRVQAGYPRLKYRVQVCSMQTLVRRLDGLDPCDIVIIDEAHHLKASSYLKILDVLQPDHILGVTATPRRPDGKPLSDVMQHLVTGPSMRFLIDNGYLSDYDYFAPDDVDMTGAHIRMGDYVKSEMVARVDKRVIIGSAIDHYRKHADRLPAIASCASIAHAEHVAQEFRDAGYGAQAIHSKLDEREIDRAIAGLRDGAINVLCQVDLLGEGVDMPYAQVLIGLRPTNSEVIFLQHAGRVLRSAKGKGNAIFLDHVGNWSRHGLPDDEREWSLEGAPARETGRSKYKRCPDCMRPVPVATRVCPDCGHQWTETAEAEQRLPEEKDGELVAIKGGSERMTWDDLVAKVGREAGSMKQAIAIARDAGYKHTAGYVIWTRFVCNPSFFPRTGLTEKT